MKRNDIANLHSQSIDELRKRSEDLEQQLAKARLELKAGKLNNVRLPSQLTDDIARVATVIREKELGA